MAKRKRVSKPKPDPIKPEYPQKKMRELTKKKPGTATQYNDDDPDPANPNAKEDFDKLLRKMTTPDSP